MTNRKAVQIHQELLPNLHQNTCERISSMEINIAKYSLNPSLRNRNAIETLLMTAQINTDFVNNPVPSITEPSTSLVRVGTDVCELIINSILCYKDYVSIKMHGHGRLVVKVSDRGWRVMTSSRVPFKTQRPPVGVVVSVTKKAGKETAPDGKEENKGELKDFNMRQSTKYSRWTDETFKYKDVLLELIAEETRIDFEMEECRNGIAASSGTSNRRSRTYRKGPELRQHPSVSSPIGSSVTSDEFNYNSFRGGRRDRNYSFKDRNELSRYHGSANSVVHQNQERLNRTVIDGARTVLSESGLDKSFWPEAVLYFVHVWNRLCHSGQTLTPIELYIGTRGYRVWIPEDSKVIETSNVRFQKPQQSCRWVYNLKRDENGKVIGYKARLVAQGYSQIKGENYDDTFSPVVNFSVIRLFFSLLVVWLKWKHFQCDVTGAYLYAPLNEEVYMKQPQGYIDIVGFSDADFAANRDDRVSMGGQFICLGNAPITWRTFKEKSVSLSTMEAEFMSMVECIKEITWLDNIMNECVSRDVVKYRSKPVLLADNQAAIDFLKSPIENYRTKHIEVMRGGAFVTKKAVAVDSEARKRLKQLFKVPDLYSIGKRKIEMDTNEKEGKIFKLDASPDTSISKVESGIGNKENEQKYAVKNLQSFIDHSKVLVSHSTPAIPDTVNNTTLSSNSVSLSHNLNESKPSDLSKEAVSDTLLLNRTNILMSMLDEFECLLGDEDMNIEEIETSPDDDILLEVEQFLDS
ncbi:retrovirus-related Pol polyprotein from transposon TNT 1-94 [Trichonephila clavipes]|nr:retrovirus-related Pol polyprotein from transposon TNT 1-94 [Trichonephila clavipes]